MQFLDCFCWLQLQILEREQMKRKFKDLASDFEHGISEISCDKLDISEDIKEQVNIYVLA